MKFIVSGGIQRKNAYKLGHGHRFKQGVLIEVDFEKKTKKIILEYKSPNIVCPDYLPSTLFSCISKVKEELYVCTPTEVIIYHYPSMKIIGYISEIFFNDIHHVSLIDNKIYIVNTGLDAIAVFDRDNLKLVEIISVLDGKKFDPQKIDYRKINSTKPHRSHPNYIFKYKGMIWITRFYQQDIFNIITKQSIKISDVGIHDGFVSNEDIYFTSVDGNVIKLNSNNEVINYNLNLIKNNTKPLGWCRGLYINNTDFYVGFSRLRRTKIEENIKWAINKFSVKKKYQLPTRIVRYDRTNFSKIDRIVFDVNELSAIFSIIKID